MLGVSSGRSSAEFICSRGCLGVAGGFVRECAGEDDGLAYFIVSNKSLHLKYLDILKILLTSLLKYKILYIDILF